CRARNVVDNVSEDAEKNPGGRQNERGYQQGDEECLPGEQEEREERDTKDERARNHGATVTQVNENGFASGRISTRERGSDGSFSTAMTVPIACAPGPAAYTRSPGMMPASRATIALIAP